MQWLEIKPTDDEKTVARKKKLLKSYKSKKRFQQMDVQQKERQTSWQNFQKGKGSKAKSGRWQTARAWVHCGSHQVGVVQSVAG
jgi:survival-of-motor-neuron-related-splicing factor 30